jgi:protein-tyrosine phosphatase
VTEFTILTVCTGNVCRSPLAEQLLRAGLADIPGVTVASAGTGALVGEPMPREAAELSVRYGGSPDGHRGRDLTGEQVRGADLVLGMSREHRRAAVQLHPLANRHAFTLRQFQRLVTGVTQEDFGYVTRLPLDDLRARLVEAVELAASRRGLELPEAPEDDGIVDPYRRSQSVYDLSASQLVPAVDATVAFFTRAATITAP